MKIGIVLMQIRIRIKMEIRIRMPKHNIAKEASLKTIKATGEAFNPQKKTSSTSKHENSKILYFFLFLRVISALLDPDPATQIMDPQPCHIPVHTLPLSPVLAAGAEPVPGPGAMFPALVYG
jgi:hypothetical protein